MKCFLFLYRMCDSCYDTLTLARIFFAVFCVSFSPLEGDMLLLLKVSYAEGASLSFLSSVYCTVLRVTIYDRCSKYQFGQYYNV